MTAFGILWFILIAVLLIGYFVLDGFDLGVGILYPLIAKNDKERMTLIRAIGPVWDGNEVWLLTAGGALFAAFAPAYATSFSGFYLAIMLVLFGLILRAVSIEFRAHVDVNARGEKKFWDILFVVGSLIPALLFGVAVGNVLGSLPLNSHGDYVGTFWALLDPFSLLCGVLGLVHMISQGANWIALKTPIDSDLHKRATSMRLGLVIADVAAFFVVSVFYLVFIMPEVTYSVGCMPLAILGAVLFLATQFGIFKYSKSNKPKADLIIMILVSVGCAAIVIIMAATLFPNLIPARLSIYSITIANAAATDATLIPMTIIACIGVPIMLVYHVLVYRAFRGRLGK